MLEILEVEILTRFIIKLQSISIRIFFSIFTKYLIALHICTIIYNNLVYSLCMFESPGVIICNELSDQSIVYGYRK